MGPGLAAFSLLLVLPASEAPAQTYESSVGFYGAVGFSAGWNDVSAFAPVRASGSMVGFSFSAGYRFTPWIGVDVAFQRVAGGDLRAAATGLPVAEATLTSIGVSAKLYPLALAPSWIPQWVQPHATLGTGSGLAEQAPITPGSFGSTSRTVFLTRVGAGVEVMLTEHWGTLVDGSYLVTDNDVLKGSRRLRARPSVPVLATRAEPGPLCQSPTPARSPNGVNMTKHSTQRRKFLRALALAASTILFTSSLAAVAQAEQAWVRRAKQLFEADEYQEVIELAGPHRKKNIGAMFLAFSHLQENIFNGTKYDKEMFKQFRLQLEAKTTANDIDDLLYFVNLNDKPEVVKESRKLSGKAFKNIKQIEDVPKLVQFLGSNDEGARKLALQSISRILKPKRDYVNKGGTLRKKDINVMGSSKLIVPLLDRVEAKDARNALLMIEEPTLKYLGRYEGPEYTKLDVELNKRIGKRKEKYPESNWYSAVGKKR